MRLLSLGTGVLFFVCAISVAAPAIAQPEPPVIHACVGVLGVVRIVSAATECRPSETAISWNQQGPAGAPGAPGAPGDPGAPGPQGPPGPDQGLNVVDASGVVIGRFTTALRGPSHDGVVIKPDQDNTLIIGVSAGSFAWSPSLYQMFWTSSDCTTGLYFSVPRGAQQPLVNRDQWLFQSGDVVYADFAAPPESISGPYFKMIGGVPLTESCVQIPVTVLLTPTKRWTVPNYLMPFRVE
jgi:hypothetical protein